MRLLPEPAPPLPGFRSLVVHGPYPPSAPIHLCLSVPPPHHAILFSPSRHSLLQTLQDHSDPWLSARSGTGTVTGASTRVTVFYPPSPTHLAAALAMLRTHDLASPSAPVAPNVTLDRTPSLLVLHEPSAYFLPEQEEYQQDTRSSPGSLVVFDTQLDHLKLPVLRTPPRNTFDEHDGPEDDSRPESVLFFAEKYFELSAAFQHNWNRMHENLFLRCVALGLLLISICIHVVHVQIPRLECKLILYMSSEVGVSGFVSFVLKPGSSLHPSFLLAADCAFAALFLVFAWSAYLTNGSIHFFFLMAIEIALWASIKWFAKELRVLQDEVSQKKDQ